MLSIAMIEDLAQGPVPVAQAAAPPSPTPSNTPPPDPLGEFQADARVLALQEHRKWLLDVDHETSISFDKVLTTLSAGALGIAVNLGRGKGVFLIGLGLSWASFTASLLAMLFSYLTCRRELGRNIGDVDWKLSHREDETPPVQYEAPWHEVTTYQLNRVALLFMITGICFLIAFAAINL
jgi:hypothetical protein